jgi:AraC-like DNA-binding protein
LPSPVMTPAASALPSWSYGRNAEIGMTPEARLDAFRMATSPAWQVEAADAGSFDMSESVYLMGSGVVFVSHFPDMKVQRTEQCVRRAEVEYYALQLKQRGEIRLDAQGKRTRVAAGQILLSDFTRTSLVELEEGPQLMALIPRDGLDRVLSRSLDLHGLNLHEMAGGAAGLLASHLTALGALLPRLKTAEAASALQATTYLLAATLAPSIESLGMAREAIDQSLMHQARELVDKHLKSPALGPETLCRQLNVSRSKLYRLFEPFGGVTTYIKERRLAQIHADLVGRAGQPAHRHLGRLADDYGFLSQSSFSRAFREQFGYSPREAKDMRFSAESSATLHRVVENGANSARPRSNLWPHSALELQYL